VLLLGAAGALLTVCLFFGDSLSNGRLFWIGIVVEVIAFGGLVAALAGLVPIAVPSRVGRAAPGFLAAFVAWTGLTMAWSIAADRSWDYFNRGLVYLAFCVLGLLVASASPRPARAVAAGLAVLLLGVVGWALLGKVFPSLFPDGGRLARLRNPIGYWNALALACATALPLGLWLATRRGRRRDVRAVGALLVYGAIVALVLTASRAGVVVAAVACLLWLGWMPARLESIGALLLAGVPAAAVAGWASTRAGLADDGQPYAVRRHDGAWFGVVLCLVGLAVLAAAWWAAERDERFDSAELRRRWALRLGVGLGVACLAGVIGVSAAAGGPGAWLREFRGSEQAPSSSGHLTSLSSNNRWTWWKEAWHLFEEDPGGGKGAATFEIARRPIRNSSVVTIEPHNIALQALAETGIVGFLLGAVGALAALGAAARAVRRLNGEDRAAAVAVGIAIPVYLLHALADVDWDFVAVSAPALFAAGLLVGMDGTVAPARVRFHALPAIAVLAALLAGLYSLTAPWLSSNRVDDSLAALIDSKPQTAASAARDAGDLNPLSPDPIWALASAYASVGDVPDATKEYERATRLQPENSDTWQALGEYELCFGDVFLAYRALNQAYTLDPYAAVKGGPLDQARAAVEKRGMPACRKS
jgi:hypothetical protein